MAVVTRVMLVAARHAPDSMVTVLARSAAAIPAALPPAGR
jgi:hypothetical protein